MIRHLIVSIKEVTGSSQESLHCFKEFAVSDFASEVTPQHFNRIEPGAVSWQVKEDQATSSPTDHSFDLIIFVGGEVVPGDIDDLIEVLIK